MSGAEEPMKAAKRRFGWRHALGVAAFTFAAVAFTLGFIVWSGIADRAARGVIVEQIEKATGASVELSSFHFAWLSLHATLRGLTLHGREPAGTPPLFHAEQLDVAIHIESFWGRRISLRSVVLQHFSAHVRIEPGGATNLPAPAVPRRPGKSLREQIFALQIGSLRLDDGEILFNDTRVPLVAEGGRFDFAMDYATPGAQPVYLCRMSWKNFEVAARRYLPFASDVSAKFSFTPASFSLTQLLWKGPHAEIDAQANLASFEKPDWTFRYRGLFNLDEFRTILRKPHTPAGRVEFTGEGSYAAKKLSVHGRYTAEDIATDYPWFHEAAMSSRGSYRADEKTLDVPDLEAHALGGDVTGKLHLDFHGQRFHVETHGRGMNLGRVLTAVDNPSLPIRPLHWSGVVDTDAVTTWVADFKNVESSGLSLWSHSGEARPGEIPAMARLEYRYSMAGKRVDIAPSEITTATSHVTFHGSLGEMDSSLDTIFDTEVMSTWDDFINRLRGPDAEPKLFGGQFHWQGRITGPLAGPLFAGHAKGTQARYGDLHWDEVECELSYSPDELHLTRGRARAGASSSDFELDLSLHKWKFEPDSEWSFDVGLVGANIDDLQRLFGTSYPVHGFLTGQFHWKGARDNPELSGLFDVSAAEAWTWRLDRARGEIHMQGGEVRISNIELHLPPYAGGAPSGLLTGNLVYHTVDQQIEFDLAGASIPLEGIQRIQSPRLPVGGRLNLQVRGQGALFAPEMHGTLRIVDLKFGDEVAGSFEGKADSDGHQLTLQINSAMTTGQLDGKFEITLGGDYPVSGQVNADKIDLDPFIFAALHLNALTGHSSVDGHFALAGFAAHPETLAVEVNLSRISLDYEFVKLESAGPVRLTYRRDEVRVEQANLRGKDTDFRVSGSARFTGDRALDLRVDGAVNLALAGGFVPGLDATGRAQVNATINGTFGAPRFVGKLHVEGASARYGDFPAGLSGLTGDFNFDAARLVFENVTAQSGGGNLTLAGTVSYGNAPLRYTLTMQAQQVRIRYPVGMSWLAGGTLQLSGNAQAATLSGRVIVDRLLMAEGFDFAALVGNSSEPVTGPATTSAFLRNLQFDIQADSSPDARMEWTGATFQTEARLRVRGTWEHPILLGHIQLLNGLMAFRGNQYRLTRGDIDFANPFRIDPVLNVEAATTIQQYEVTLDFTGPASRLTLAYRSDPPLPSTDIISLLALGQTSEQRTQGGATGAQTPTLGATTLLSEAISSQLGGRIERLFGISHFRVDPGLAGPTSGQTAIARVTLQQQITRDLVITYITDITSTQQQVIQIEYTVNREFSIVALRDENGTFGLDIIRKTRFK